MIKLVKKIKFMEFGGNAPYRNPLLASLEDQNQRNEKAAEGIL